MNLDDYLSDIVTHLEAVAATEGTSDVGCFPPIRKYGEYVNDASDLASWCRDVAEALRDFVAEMQVDGWSVTSGVDA